MLAVLFFRDTAWGHDSERRNKPMIPMITALVFSRRADRV
jgi:hypothetical protein